MTLGNGSDVVGLLPGIVIHLQDFLGFLATDEGIEWIPRNRPSLAKIGKLRNRLAVPTPVKHEVLSGGIGETQIHSPRNMDLGLEGIDHVADQ